MQVRKERTAWRDAEISARHREWGWNCPGVDLDFLMVEYNRGLPVGLIEYKHYKAQMPNQKHPTYRALSTLANAADLPFLLCFYWPECWAFKVYPVNEIAKQHYTDPENMTEREFVTRLYRLRRLALSADISPILNDVKPPLAPTE